VSIQLYCASNILDHLMQQPHYLDGDIENPEFAYALNDGINAATIGVLSLTSAIINESLLLTTISLSFLFIAGFNYFVIFGFLFVVFFLINTFFGRKIAIDSSTFATFTVKSRVYASDFLESRNQTIFTSGANYLVHRFLQVRAMAGASFAKAQSSMQLSKNTLEIAFLILILALSLISEFYSAETSISGSDLGLMLAFGIRLLPALLKVQSYTLSLKSTLPAANTIHKITNFAITHKIPKIEHSNSLSPEFSKNLDFTANSLGLRFDSSPEYLFRSLDLQIQCGDFILINGTSGSGKTSLMRVLSGVLEPNEGSVKINGKRINDWRSTNLNRIVYGPQEPLLFSGSLRDNILMGTSELSLPSNYLELILDATCLTDFVSEMSGGLETQILGESFHPSGGESQRIGLARILALQPELIILDEPTSALDPRTEERVFQNLKNLGLSIVMVSHSTSAEKYASQIITLGNPAGVLEL
jgi:ATP-binding cassette subfamily B protein